MQHKRKLYVYRKLVLLDARRVSECMCVCRFISSAVSGYWCQSRMAHLKCTRCRASSGRFWTASKECGYVMSQHLCESAWVSDTIHTLWEGSEWSRAGINNCSCCCWWFHVWRSLLLWLQDDIRVCSYNGCERQLHVVAWVSVVSAVVIVPHISHIHVCACDDSCA